MDLSFTSQIQTIQFFLLIHCNESICEGMHAFVLNIKNCNFKVTLVKIESINRRLSFSLALSLSLSLSLSSLDVNVCAKEGGKEKMGDFIFMMVECLRTDHDYAIFRNELRVVDHFVNLEQKIAYATCTPPIMPLIWPPKFCISMVFNFSWDGCNTQGK